MDITINEYKEVDYIYGFFVEPKKIEPNEKIGLLVHDTFKIIYKKLINSDSTIIRYMKLQDIINELNIYFRSKFISYNRFPIMDNDYFNLIYTILYQNYFINVKKILNDNDNNINDNKIDDILISAEEQFYSLLFLKSDNQYELSYEFWKLDIDINKELCAIYGISQILQT